MIKKINKTRWKFPQPNKGHLQKSKANNIINGERLKALPLRSGRRQKCPLLPRQFNIILGVIAREITQEIKIQGFSWWSSS